jgi:hypothetical protein
MGACVTPELQMKAKRSKPSCAVVRRGDFGAARVLERALVRWDLVIPTATVVLEMADSEGIDFV